MLHLQPEYAKIYDYGSCSNTNAENITTEHVDGPTNKTCTNWKQLI